MQNRLIGNDALVRRMGSQNAAPLDLKLGVLGPDKTRRSSTRRGN